MYKNSYILGKIIYNHSDHRFPSIFVSWTPCALAWTPIEFETRSRSILIYNLYKMIIFLKRPFTIIQIIGSQKFFCRGPLGLCHGPLLILKQEVVSLKRTNYIMYKIAFILRKTIYNHLDHILPNFFVWWTPCALPWTPYSFSNKKCFFKFTIYIMNKN